MGRKIHCHHHHHLLIRRPFGSSLTVNRFVRPTSSCRPLHGNHTTFRQPQERRRLLSASPPSAVAAASLDEESISSSDDDDDDDDNDDGESTTKGGGGERRRSVEEQYSRKTPLEHVLLRPGMYVGPTERMPSNHCWVLDPTPPPYRFSDGDAANNKSNPQQLSSSSTSSMLPTPKYRMVHKEYSLIPALVKVFDEILVNATDNRHRNPKTCNRLEVCIDPGSFDLDEEAKSDEQTPRPPTVRIFNNGKGIPIHIHKEEQLWVPELLFGHLLTGSNFDDTERRVTGGRHGYGAKLTNIFSQTFVVETVDARRRLRYRQTWYDNMTRVGEPQIDKLDDDDKGLEDYTCITFVPDVARLSGDPSMTTIDQPNYALMCRRVVDAAGCAAGKMKVFLNGHDVSMKSFAAYSNLYRQRVLNDGSGGSSGEEEEDMSPTGRMCFGNIGSRWTVGVGLSESNSFESVSFVNGMATPRGGTHVNAIVAQVAKRIEEKAAKLDPSLADTLTLGLIRRNLFVSCNTLIENPSFDSQMKEYLTSSPSSFGTSSTLTERFLSELVQPEEDGGPGIVEEVLRVARGRQQANLFKQVGGKKTKRQLLSIPKLEDAHGAGSDSSGNCTLILTEGDSAKALAIAGMEVIGRENYGVFPLRGKFLNVRHATVDQLAKNEEVKALVAILGLDFDKEYNVIEERKELRYGHVMLMTDQDTDGSHIKGLVINFIRFFWPKLLKPAVDEPFERPFLSSFVTPLLKATRKGSKKTTLSFYSMAEFDAWRNKLPDPTNDIGNWKIKYYKGLGTSTPTEAKEYFSNFEKHHRPFLWNSDLDGELLDKIFDKDRAAERRDWITNEYRADATLIYDGEGDKRVTYEDFVNLEMIHFSNADNIRSIPSAIDGLKPSQRKVLFACFKRKLKDEMKVAQLSGYCAEHTSYHHGEASLQSTIIGMAQDYVGSNNINLLVPSGQFGTRLAGGEDAASPRYIFTHLSPLSRFLFPEDDDMLLEYLEDDGQAIEPRFFCPIIPLLLVNGSQGIGTGWSTFISQHCPMTVLDYIRAKLDQRTELPPIEPYSRGFTGTIDRHDGHYMSCGKIKKLDNKTVLIEELPIGIWTNKYKSILLNMQSKGKIVDFTEDHTTQKVSFMVKLKPAQLVRMQQSGLEKAFRLTANHSLTNMNAFDAQGQIQKFHSAEAIADAFFPTRLSLYHDRKSVLMSQMEYNAAVQRNKARFIQMVADQKVGLVGGQMSKEESISELKKHGFDTTEDLDVIRNNNSVAARQSGQYDGRDNEDDLLEEEEYEFEEGQASSSSASFDYLLKMPLSSLARERIATLTQDATKMDSDFQQIRRTPPEELWMNDLEKLASKLQQDNTL